MVRCDGLASVPPRWSAIACRRAASHSFLVLKPPLVCCRRRPVSGLGSTSRYHVQVLPRLRTLPSSVRAS